MANGLFTERDLEIARDEWPALRWRLSKGRLGHRGTYLEGHYNPKTKRYFDIERNLGGRRWFGVQIRGFALYDHDLRQLIRKLRYSNLVPKP